MFTDINFCRIFPEMASLLVQEVLGVDAEAAEALLVAFHGDADAAICHFMESNSHGDANSGHSRVEATQQQEVMTVASHRARLAPAPQPTTIAPAPAVGDAYFQVECYLAWSAEELECRVDHGATVYELKRAIAAKARIPVVVQRIVYDTNNLDDNERLATYFSKRSVAVAVLYARRDEEGCIHVSQNNESILRLNAGEWNFSYPIRELKAVVATKLKSNPDDFMLVFNGLSLKDFETFGMCGLHGGSTISVLSVKKV